MVNKATVKRVNSRMPKAKLAPEVAAMRARGMKVREIAKALNRSERSIYNILRYAKTDGSGLVLEVPDPKDLDDLEPEVQERVRFTPEGFEKFFNAYSGRTLQDVHRNWVRDALSGDRVLINCPPRHAKSTLFSVWFPIWGICMDRDIQILLCSQTDKLSKKFTNEISYQLSYNQDLIRDFGRFRPEMSDWPWRPNSGELLVEGRKREVKSGDLTIQVRGAGQQILGMEANWVIVDDPVSRRNVRSESEREKLSEWFHGDVLTRLEPKGRAIVIGQRLHMNDLYGELAQESILTSEGDHVPRWKHINYPAIKTWPDKEAGIKPEVLWPEKWDFQALMERYSDLGSSLFEAMYQQEPLPEGERLAKREWIYGSDTSIGCLDYDRVQGSAPRGLKDRVRVLSLDPSPTRYAGLIVADLEQDLRRFDMHVIEIMRQKMPVREMLYHIERVVETYQPDYFVFEQNAAQRWLLQDPSIDKLKKRIRIVPHNTGRNKGDPQLGIESLAVDFEFGKIRLPYGDAESRAMSEMLIREVLSFPQGETDDLLMAIWFVKFNYSRLVPVGVRYNTETVGRGWRTPPRLRDGFPWARKRMIDEQPAKITALSGAPH